jgi:hypothetical protein
MLDFMIWMTRKIWVCMVILWNRFGPPLPDLYLFTPIYTFIPYILTDAGRPFKVVKW